MDAMEHTRGSDEYLTPPEMIAALGPFDTDVCVCDNMPWRTAARMITKAENGLTTPWEGFVFMNPPYSRVGPWAKKFLAHGNGLALISAKSADSKWCQSLLREASAICLLAGRISFYHPTGEKSLGSWLPSMLLSIGEEGKKRIMQYDAPGVRFVRTPEQPERRTP